MFNRKLSLLLAVFMLAVTVFAASPAPTASAQDFGAMLCPNVESPYYQPGVFLRYSIVTDRVSLIDLYTGQEVRELAANFPADYFHHVNWSPDCRYVTAVRNHLGYYGNQRAELFIWDTQTGELVNTLEEGIVNHWNPEATGVIWSPDSSRALMSTRRGVFIWDAAARTNTLLTHAEGIIPNFADVAWDYANNQVIVSGYPAVIAYNLTSGAQQALYRTAADHDANSRFVATPDVRTMVVYTQHAYTGESTGYITAYNMSTGTAHELDANGFAANFAEQAAISPDGHYFTIGITHLRVWDLTGDSAAPAYNHILGDRQSLESNFVDDTTVRLKLFPRIYDVNVLTGEKELYQ